MNISPEILELILAHLDENSLKSCLRVSNFFRECILTSPNIMRKLPLRMNSKNWKSKIEFLKNHGDKIKTVELRWNNSNCAYYKFLHFTPMISKLKLDIVGSTNVRAKGIESKNDTEIVEIINALTYLNEDININCDDQLSLPHLIDFNGRFYRLDPCVIIRMIKDVKHLKRFNLHCSSDIQMDHDTIVNFMVLQIDLKRLELKVEKIDKIFTPESIDKMKFRLNKLTLVPSYYAENNYKSLNKFLISQKSCLEELRVFSWRCEDEIAEGICSLEKLKKLTTHGVPPYFKQHPDDDVNCVVMKSLTHFRYYSGNTNENFDDFVVDKILPNLYCLNVHFGLDHRLFGHYPDVKVDSNPLRNLKNLREFHIESYNQNLLHHLASQKLELLAITCEDALFDIASWSQMGKNMPKLETVIIEKVERRFLKFIVENHERFIQKLRNLKKLILRYDENDVLNFIIENGKVEKVSGLYVIDSSLFLTCEDDLRKKFENFDMTMISSDEYEEKYEYWHCYFHQCGP